jgi:alpha,alpha-trehalose phosphorylase
LAFIARDNSRPRRRSATSTINDPLTTHDSSLSVCIQSIVANEVGYRDRAMRYFNFAAVMDLSDVGGNMRHGPHIASIGGTWMALVYGETARSKRTAQSSPGKDADQLSD